MSYREREHSDLHDALAVICYALIITALLYYIAKLLFWALRMLYSCARHAAKQLSTMIQNRYGQKVRNGTT